MIYFVLFLLGAILVPAGDMVHVLTQTTTYPTEQMSFSIFGLIPFWVPLLFGCGGVASVFQTKIIRSKFSRTSEAPPIQWAMAGFVFMAMYFLSGILSKMWFIDGLLLSSGVLLFYFLGDKSRGGLLQALSIMFGGTLVEVILVQNQIFSYSDTNNRLFGVASWLPWLYLGVAVSVDSLVKWSEKNKS